MKLTVERRFTPLELAEAFCELQDEDQAQFFIEAARIAEAWNREKGSLGASWQWFTVGKHLKRCAWKRAALSNWEERGVTSLLPRMPYKETCPSRTSSPLLRKRLINPESSVMRTNDLRPIPYPAPRKSSGKDRISLVDAVREFNEGVS